jgi:hypothetical protein
MTAPERQERLTLDQVTLCAIDCLNARLAGRALALSMEQCGFAEALLLSDEMSVPDGVRGVRIPRLDSRDAYSRFVLRDLHRHVTTPHVLIVQWDGYVVDAGCWQDGFLAYDYIGAEWPWHGEGAVGNGGFSLRSRRLLQVTASPDFAVPGGRNEDELICRDWRPALERDHGMRFAPVRVARAFSYERGAPRRPSFGFHGAFNLWRHAGDAEQIALAAALDAATLRTPDVVEWMLALYTLGKFAVLRALWRRWRALHPGAAALDRLTVELRLGDHADGLVDLGDALIEAAPCSLRENVGALAPA